MGYLRKALWTVGTLITDGQIILRTGLGLYRDQLAIIDVAGHQSEAIRLNLGSEAGMPPVPSVVRFAKTIRRNKKIRRLCTEHFGNYTC